MTDIIDEIDRLHAEATPGPWQRDLDRKCGDYGIGAAVPEFDGEYAVIMQPNCHVTNHQANVGLTIALRNNWPALRDRLRDAERKAKIALDELGNIARAKPYAVPEPWADDFIPWAQSRARDAIEAATREHSS